MAALDDLDIDEITEIINKIYVTVLIIPEDLSTSIFIDLPKKPGENESKPHWTIGLMNHITKFIQILMNRAWSRIRPEMGQEQWVFVKEPEMQYLYSEWYRKEQCKSKYNCVFFTDFT